VGAGTALARKIFLALYPSTGAGQPVMILSTVQRRWQYSVELPDTLERVQYVRASCRVLLLEFSNRTAGAAFGRDSRVAGEGFTQQLLAAKETRDILRPSPPANGRPESRFANVSGAPGTVLWSKLMKKID